jgi:hypothetical protein
MHSIPMVSDPAVTAIVTIYSLKTTFGCRVDFRKAMKPCGRNWLEKCVRSQMIEDYPDQ